MIERPHNTPGELFVDLPPAPTEHFKICFFGTILGFIAEVAGWHDSFEKAMERFPFLAGYNNELARRLEGLPADEAFALWWAGLEAWESQAQCHLPIRALRQATGLDHHAVAWLMTLGLADEDERFGAVLEAFQGGSGQRRVTFGFARRCWQERVEAEAAWRLLARFRELGLVQVPNPDAPRQEWGLLVPGLVWDALRGGRAPAADWLRFREPAELPSFDELIVPPETLRVLRTLPRLVEAGAARALIVRGPRHNGRHTALGAVARALGLGMLELRGLERPEDERWRQAGALGLLLRALPVAEFALSPGETVSLPELKPEATPVGFVLGAHGGASGSLVADALTVRLELADPDGRLKLWQRFLGSADRPGLPAISERFRLTSGNIYRAARLARNHAALAERSEIRVEDVNAATRALHRQALDSLARRLEVAGDLSHLCAAERTLRELEHLERRCRHRERLPETFRHAPGGPRNCGVRALFTGPSGTGKTLAARLLAASLGKDLYQLDLSAVVNKYIGETEKNLHRVLECAEELDVLLLLDEGDALLTRRTDVASANDRYANLETNFLLQRLENFQGILLVTTNSRDRLDSAFERRMDVVVEFLAPDADVRWQLWQSHLPAARRVDDHLLAEIAGRCDFNGGQIRNASLHAALLAFDNGGVISSEYLEAAVRREYQKLGAACPLRSSSES